MSEFDVCESLNRALFLAKRVTKGVLQLNPSQQNAVNILLNVLNLKNDVPLGGIQGPPGTGKTTVIEGFVHQLASKDIREMDGLLIYVAPTNYLVMQAFERVAATLIAKGFTLSDVVEMVKLFGYKINAETPCSKLPEWREIGSVPSDMAVRGIVGGKIDPSKVKLIFTTEYQRVSSEFAKKPKEIFLVVDEASRSPFYRPFISLADEIMRYKDYPYALVGLGDPEQAITISKGLKIEKVPLLMEKIKNILSEYKLDKNYIMLDTTYRLPSPSEKPISHGFYEDKLLAFEAAESRLKALEEIVEDLETQAKNRIEQVFSFGSLKGVFDKISEAVTTHTPIVLVPTSEFNPEKDVSTLDIGRIKLGLKAAIVLGAFISVAKEAGSYQVPTMMVTAPYSDMVLNTSFQWKMIRSKASSKIERPRFATVQSVIGGEADIVITMLGKEYVKTKQGYYTNKNYYYWGNEYSTIYFNEPQVLNVQLSRHRELLIVVGNVDKLASSSFNEKVSNTAAVLNQLAAKVYQ